MACESWGSLAFRGSRGLPNSAGAPIFPVTPHVHAADLHVIDELLVIETALLYASKITSVFLQPKEWSRDNTCRNHVHVNRTFSGPLLTLNPISNFQASREAGKAIR